MTKFKSNVLGIVAGILIGWGLLLTVLNFVMWIFGQFKGSVWQIGRAGGGVFFLGLFINAFLEKTKLEEALEKTKQELQKLKEEKGEG